MFVHDPEVRLALRLNRQLVTAERLDDTEGERLRVLLEAHCVHTGSARAGDLLAAWPEVVEEFRLVRPRAEVSRIEAEAEGTEHSEPAPDRDDVGVPAP